MSYDNRGGKGGPKLVSLERAERAVTRICDILDAEEAPRNCASLLGAARLLLEQWRAESGQSDERESDGKLTKDQIRMLLASDPELRQMAKTWDEQRQ